MLTGTVSAAERDTVPPNNTDQASVVVDLATVDLTVVADLPVVAPGNPTTIVVKAVTRSRRPARNATVCVRVPGHLSVGKPAGATLGNGRVCWRIARLARGRSRTFVLHATARQVTPCVRTTPIAIDVRGTAVRTRR